jgi:tetratricopeptide (TPR) repeat protein
MEPRLSLLATAAQAAVALALLSGTARADSNKKALARQLFELGIDEYKQKDYEGAAASMAKSFALDPIPETLYAEAQAERLAGDCIDASVHYTKLLDLAKDNGTATAVKANLELCSQIERGEKPKEDTAKDARDAERRDAPTVQIRTVYRTQQRSDKLAVALFVVGGIGIGGAVVTYLAGVSARSDADSASTLADYNKLFDRSVTLKNTSYLAAGAGALLVGYATFRVLHGSSSVRIAEKVGVIPTKGGSMVSWNGSW